MQKTFTSWLKAGTAVLCLASSCLAFSPAIAQERYLYRYVDENGVKVLNHSIPPKYAQKGYEVLSQGGQLIKVVPPAPTNNDLAQETQDRVLRERFEVLKRRYSSLNDLESAKLRRLENIKTNISIMRGNIGGITLRIDNLMADAVKIERSGKEVPAHLLQQLEDTRAELAVAQSGLDIRLKEYQSVSDRYDEDLATFIEGIKLVERHN